MKIISMLKLSALIFSLVFSTIACDFLPFLSNKQSSSGSIKKSQFNPANVKISPADSAEILSIFQAPEIQYVSVSIERDPFLRTGTRKKPEERAPETTTPVTPTVTAPPVVTEKEPTFVLTGILQTESYALATINGKSVQVGSVVDGARVTRIEGNKVYLNWKGKSIVLTMK